MSNFNIVVSGATGWIGSELIRELLSSENFLHSNIYPTASKEGVIKISNRQFTVTKLDNITNSCYIDYYFDFAFLTRDKFNIVGHEKYIDTNQHIINESVKFIKIKKPKVVVLASSGAIYKTNNSNKNMENQIYGDLKLLQETKIKNACDEVNSKLIIARIFNLSGSGINKVNIFAIAEFVYKSVKNQDIFITSNYSVVRRYCDISQLLNLIISLTLENKSFIFDSGGTKIEIRKLANKIVHQLDSRSRISALDIDNTLSSDNYYSNSNYYEDLLEKYLKKKSIAISDQIEFTRKALF
jgi:nucleoside-diphosphate-sugar epimerase